MRVYGQEQETLNREAAKLKESIAAIPGLVEAEIEAPAEEPVIEIKVDLESARKFGVKPGDVRRAAAMMLSGIEVGNLFEEQKVFEVVVWGTRRCVTAWGHINDLLIGTPGGGHVAGRRRDGPDVR